MNTCEFSSEVERLRGRPCYIMDFLPARVPPNAGGQFYNVENYILGHMDELGLRARITGVLLKLMCYCRVNTDWNGWRETPSPELVANAVKELLTSRSGTLNLLLPDDDALVVFEWDCMNISVYNPSENIKNLLSAIASSENMSWRRAIK